MLHCFQCGSDLPDNLAYCLNCGARLDDSDAKTVVDPPVVRPDGMKPDQIEPKTGGGVAKFLIGGLLGAGAVIVFLVALGFVAYYVIDPNQTNTTANNKQDTVNTPTPTPTETPTPTPRKPTPTPENDNTETAADVKICDVVNPAGGTVNLRRYCDTRDCSQDPTTLYIQAEQGDIVELTNRKPVTTGRFTWVQVKYGGEILWISSTRINCD